MRIMLACALVSSGRPELARAHRMRAERLYTSLRHAPGLLELSRCWDAAVISASHANATTGSAAADTPHADSTPRRQRAPGRRRTHGPSGPPGISGARTDRPARAVRIRAPRRGANQRSCRQAGNSGDDRRRRRCADDAGCMVAAVHGRIGGRPIGRGCGSSRMTTSSPSRRSTPSRCC